MHPSFATHSPGSRRRETGLTLIELMVALALGLVITLAAAGALVVARQGFTSVDSTSQLRENARFAAEVLQRIVVQAGFEDIASGHHTRMKVPGVPEIPADPGIQGYDNAWLNLAGLPASLANASRPGAVACGAADTTCKNGSDVLVVRYWGASATPGGAADASIINCAGIAEPEPAAGGDRAYSIFHVSRGADNEPTLACAYLNPATSAWETRDLVKGVEGFQVLYGVDNVVPGATPVGATGQDSITDRYLTATQMIGPSAAATADNWRRVRSVRIGLLVRGDAGSALDPNATGGPTARACPNCYWDVLGDGIQTGADVGSRLTVAPDGRLRQRLVMTVHLRNQQGYEVERPVMP